MLTFDTLKFGIPLEMLENINFGMFYHQKTELENFAILSDKYIFNNKIYGLKSICVNNTAQNVIIEVSAKLLQCQYAENFNYKNFYEIFFILMKNKIFKLAKSFTPEKISFYRCDLSKNIKVPNDCFYFIESFFYAMQGNNFLTQKYKNESLTFSINPTSHKRRIRGIFYDKYSELKKDKEIQKIIDIEKFKNIIRFEITVNSFYLMRKFFGTEDQKNITFKDIFKCKKNIFLDYFNLLIENFKSDKAKKISPFDNRKLYEIEKYFGRKAIIKNFNYDLKQIYSFIKKHVKGNVSNYLQEYMYLTCDEQPEENKQEIKKYLQIFKKLL